ncbi:MAG: hypothetical protein M1820_002775 [Bogoriella megaspora]|nr:MAG: hypothetical protein M1820_002775 [Bogoriella megaspora]
MAACWMAHTGVRTRIVDKRGTKIFNGQADGLQCRSLEIFDSFDFAHRVWKEANHMLEICMWNPDETGRIRRSDRMADTPPGISRFQECVLHQGRIERFFLDSIRDASRNSYPIEVERGVLPESLSVDESLVEDQEAYPITVHLRHLNEEEAIPEQQGKQIQDGLFRSNLAPDDTDELLHKSADGTEAGKEEIIRAKYMIGCDGAHSWVRRQLGFEMEGEPTDFVWGVLDIIPLTDFPDIRNRCMIHSANSGSLMVIPRENKLVRLYVQLKEVTPDASGRADRSKITPEAILSAAQKTLSPYKLTYKYCDWWTAYQIGQRVGKNFDKHRRIFLTGDAVHTHSPKAGQGMNVSMQDSFNLGWKISLVVRGIAQRYILATYQSERRRIAQDLIDFDHRFSRLFSGRPAKDLTDEEGISMQEFKEVFLRGAMFTSGLSVDYGASMLVAKPGAAIEQGDGTDVSAKGRQLVAKEGLASSVELGKRFPSFQVLNQSDARPWHFAHWLKSDGRFRVVLFAGRMTNPAQKKRVDEFCRALEKSLKRFTPAGTQIDSVVEVLTIHSAKRTEVELLDDFPAILHPWSDEEGWSYGKVFVDDESYHEGHGHAYEQYGINEATGCFIILRPDQYVAYVGALEDVADVDTYFSDVLIPQN